MEPERITAEEVKRRMDGGEAVFFMDTRSPTAWDASDLKLPGARRIHYSELEPNIRKIPRDRLVVPYCT